MKFNFLDIFSEITQTSSFTKIRPWESSLFHADGRSDMTKLTVTLRSFANAPNNREDI